MGAGETDTGTRKSVARNNRVLRSAKRKSLSHISVRCYRRANLLPSPIRTLEKTYTSPAYTPGPWLLTEKGKIRPQAIPDPACSMPFMSSAEAVEMGPHQLANARLIAAAPALVEALEELLDVCLDSRMEELTDEEAVL